MEAAEVAVDDFLEIIELNVDANVANIERQFKPQFNWLMTAELSFINRTCNLTLPQRQKIQAAREDCLKAATRKYAMSQNRMMRGGFGRQLNMVHHPTELLHLALAKPLKQALQSEQWDAYREEMTKRSAYRKHVAVENVVAMIDERLVLTVQQRKKLRELLEKNWQAGWVQSVELLMNGNRNLPNIPDRFVSPALNETQKEVWRAIPKQNYMVWGGFGWGQQVEAVDDFPLVENETAEATSVN